MAIRSTISRITLSDVGGNKREWIVTAAVQDAPAGQSVNVVIAETSLGGAAAPLVADSETLEFRIDNASTLVKSFTLTPGLATQSISFFFTANGNAGGGNRCGTVRMYLHCVNTSGL